MTTWCLLRWARVEVLLAGIAAMAAGLPSDAAEPAIRIVNCDQKVQSRKRGICANKLESADFPALAPGVSWWYNWHFETADRPPEGIAMEYIPMVWGSNPESLAGLERYLAAGHKPRRILALNEPNLKGQAFIPPEQTAKAYRSIKAVADKYGIGLVGPHMALGSAPADSISAFDPIENKQVTYGFMVPFLKSFLHYMGQEQVSATAFHSYGPLGEMRWAVDLMGKEFGRPIWVTEYNQWNAADVAAARTYLIQATDFLERSPQVEGYAWFKERLDSNAALLAKEPGRLTMLGEAYVALPVHDADVYYRIPGRLQAENYVTLEKMEIWPTTDADGFVHMSSTEAGGSIQYNIQVDTAGTYTLRLRLGDQAGTVEVLSGGQPLASVSSARNGWLTVETTAQLPAGAQTIRIRSGSKGQSINWLEFARSGQRGQ